MPMGRMQAFRYAKRLEQEQECRSLSGMAYGIDTEAHKGALEGEGALHLQYWEMALISVILQVTEQLYQRILREQEVVYSVNIRRGRGQEIIIFLHRNRIISGLADLGADCGSKRKKRFIDHCTVGT